MKKLAMIGCGGIGNYHLGHFLKYEDVILAGFCDIIYKKAAGFAERVNSANAEKNKDVAAAKAFADFREMYDEIKPDMVFICIPPSEHGEIEFETIRRGIPFFVEKPVALSMQLARKISAEVKKTGLITAVGFQCRYSNLVDPNLDYLKENEAVFVDCIRMGGIPDTPWWKIRSLSGGQIVEQTVHQFDIIRYVFDEPETVFSMGARGFVKDVEGYDTEDLSTTVVRFRNGALATISTGCYASSGSAADSKITFSCRDSRAELKILGTLQLFGTSPAPAVDMVKDGKDGFVVKGDGALKEIKAGPVIFRDDKTAGVICDRTFIDAVISGDGSKIRSPYEDAVKTLAFVLACNESIDTGKPVNIVI